MVTKKQAEKLENNYMNALEGLNHAPDELKDYWSVRVDAYKETMKIIGYTDNQLIILENSIIEKNDIVLHIQYRTLDYALNLAMGSTDDNRRYNYKRMEAIVYDCEWTDYYDQLLAKLKDIKRYEAENEKIRKKLEQQINVMIG